MHRILLIMIFFIKAVLVHAQDSVVTISNLDQAIALAVDNNATLKSVRRQQEQAARLQGTVGNIGKTGIYHSYDANNLAPNDRALRVFGVYQKIPFPTTFSEKSKLYQIQAEKALFNYDLELWKLKKEVSQAYYEWVFRENRLYRHAYLDSIFSTFSEAARKRYEVGETTYLEKITARNYYKQQHLKRLQAEEELKIAYSRLKGLIQIESNIVIREIPLDKIDWDIPSSRLTPVHKILTARVDEMGAQWRVAKSQTLPDISLEYFKGFGQGENSQNFNGYMVGLEIPLWVKPYHKYHQAMKIGVDRASYAQLNYEKQFSAKQAELAALLEKYERSTTYFENEGLPTASEIQEVARKSYYEGEIGYMDYIRSLETATQTYIQYLEDLNEYNQTYIAIYYLTDINEYK